MNSTEVCIIGMSGVGKSTYLEALKKKRYSGDSVLKNSNTPNGCLFEQPSLDENMEKMNSSDITFIMFDKSNHPSVIYAKRYERYAIEKSIKYVVIKAKCDKESDATGDIEFKNMVEISSKYRQNLYAPFDMYMSVYE